MCRNAQLNNFTVQNGASFQFALTVVILANDGMKLGD